MNVINNTYVHIIYYERSSTFVYCCLLIFPELSHIFNYLLIDHFEKCKLHFVLLISVIL